MMVAGIVLVLASLGVALAAAYQVMTVELPPKAKLLCDVWRLAEGRSHTENRERNQAD